MLVNLKHWASLALASQTALVLASAIEKRAPAPFSSFTNNVVFNPPSNYEGPKTLYGRSVQLPDKSLLITWENYRQEPPKDNFLIYRSTDGGATFKPWSTIEDTVNGWGMRWHPELYVLPSDFAGYKAGTILAAGTSIPRDISQTYIDLYVSTDNAKTWKFLSHVAYGSGPADARKEGKSAVWEPFLMLYKGQLICYYSDQTDPAHSQKLVLKTTKDLKKWSGPAPVQVDPNQNGRPGMAVVAAIGTTGRYILTFEHCGTNDCRLTYKVANSPLNFNSAQPVALTSNDPFLLTPGSTAYVTWVKNPKRTDGSGLIYANAASSNRVFINDDSADPNTWRSVDVGQNEAYARSLRIINSNGKQKLFMVSAGVFDGSSNMVSVGAVDLPT